ncbi:MAG: peptide chain release factor N(5)-glutamine methyltransferase [Verrucomicrobiota bacterium]
MTTILDALQKGTGYLEKHGVESARLNMQHLLAQVVKCDRMQLYVSFDRPLDEPELEELRRLMKERANGTPLQHLLGTTEFFGKEFLCDERALIPRPETEHLVDVLSQMDWPKGVRIADVGTGSGVIGISLGIALRDQEPMVVLADVSGDALSLAKENVDRLTEDLDGCNLQLVESDLFTSLDGEFDLLVANLPYIAKGEINDLSREVKRDPLLALDGGTEGTELMERFLAESRSHLAGNGMVAMEFGLGQAPELEAIAKRNGFQDVRILKDLEGTERILLARKAN